MRILAFGLAALLAAAPASAGKADDFASCAWTKVPTTAERYRISGGRDEAEAFMRLAAVCMSGGSMDLKAFKKAVEKSRPPVIGPDVESPEVFVQHGGSK